MNRLITILFLGMTAIIMQAKTDIEQLTIPLSILCSS